MPGANPFLGVLLHAIGGLAAASFYIPFKRVKGWAWEVYWLCNGVISWIVAPLLFASLLAPNWFLAIAGVKPKVLLYTYLFGVLWGIGGLTFGLSMRYLGIALGYAVALGLCALFGTLVPPCFNGQIRDLVSTGPGWVVLAGVLTCLVGITLSGKAGRLKERELSAEAKQETIAEFDFAKGMLVAIFAGVMSACMAFAFQAAKPLAERAVEYGTPELWSNLPVLVVVMLGGFTTNGIWCRLLMDRNDTVGHFVRKVADGEPVPLASNYLFSALAGLIWYLQFFFYTMGTTKMGTYDFTSWSLHMACIIIFSTLWGIALKEWKGTSRATQTWIAAGLFVLVLSVGVIGYGNKLVADAADAAKAAVLPTAAT